MSTFPSSIEPRELLMQRLATLIGVGDVGEDVLDHLLSIESKVDLLDYLSQLLGTRHEGVEVFVEDVARFQRGEALSAAIVSNEGDVGASKPHIAVTEASDSKPAAKHRIRAKGVSSAANNKVNRRNEKGAAKSTPTTQVKRNVPIVGSRAKPPMTQSTTAVAANEKLAGTTVQATTAPRKQPPQQPPKKSRPPRGKASIVCGCFGTLHKPLTNCLYCGRISCEREGYDFCPFCGILVEQVTGSSAANDNKAWQHKERLLRFDRDFARRTVVLDDQEDYYRNQTSTWLTQGEQEEASEQELYRHATLHSKQKQKLSLEF